MKKNQIIQSLFILLILFFISSCRKNEAYLYYNENYYSIFHDRYKVYNSIKKSLYRYFFDVDEIAIDSFSYLESELDKVIKSKTSALIFLEDFISPLLLKSYNIKNEYIKLLTYNIYKKEMPQNNNIAVFEIQVDAEIITKQLIQLLKRHSNKKDFSDCGIIIDPDYLLSKECVNKLKENRVVNIDVLELYGNDENLVKNWITEEKRNLIIMLSYNLNDFILKLKEEEFDDIIFVELMTDYGEITDKIKYKIEIDWKIAFQYALNSKLFKDFTKLSSNKMNTKKNNNNWFIYKACYDNIVSIKKYNQMIAK